MTTTAKQLLFVRCRRARVRLLLFASCFALSLFVPPVAFVSECMHDDERNTAVGCYCLLLGVTCHFRSWSVVDRGTHGTA